MRRRNPFRLKKWLPGLALLGIAGLAVVEGPQLLASIAPGGTHLTMGGGPYGDIATMRANNPNFDGQVHTWKSLRTTRGQDPLSWADFRVYQTQIGAPDPGSLPPAIWFPANQTMAMG